ncbi:heme/hemin ABC transporter substrate-binding protein [Poseidonocella sedimentorum]|uniref:Iron complex transport system substrate-binding protein n=1 Tax=Poseidonocella sedimentorum TaxID=871652 RepID=A0A1I6E4M5_9RHOB|nr:ABC transporter substrate-binding protein [Poseidonocella sedimentorum]SFR12705.1 iron complex transport system substrate-binding protein [Poseidonocella sedimentorum]
MTMQRPFLAASAHRRIAGALLLLLLLGWGALAPRGATAEPARIVALGGTVTEIVHALGAGDRLVARDTTSTFPPEARALPDVGYLRRLSPEGVLSVAPDLILATDGAGPVETIDVLRAAETGFVSVPEGYTPDAIAEKIAVIGAALGRPDAAEALMAEVAAGFAALGEAPAPARRVMFILSAQGGRLMVAGADTGADGLIALAGGTNVFAGLEGYKPVSDEAVIAAAPDLILLMETGPQHGLDDAALLALPALASTPAGRSGAILRMDGLLATGFGPRTPQAVRTLRSALAGIG